MRCFHNKTARIYSCILIMIAIVLGLMFELRPVFILVVAVVYLSCVPRLVSNQNKFAYESKRFHDVNSYMSQMAQSFIYTKDVIQSLEETASCFTEGLMHETLKEAFEILEAGKWDIRASERDALTYIESRYDCEKLKNLHIFFLNAEELGGECQKEFKILESMRIAWQSVVESIRMKRFWDRNIGTAIYVFFLLICIIMLHIMRGSNLNIISLLPTQILDAILLIGLGFYFLFMDKRLGKSLLTNPKQMSEAQADEYFRYLENYEARSNSQMFFLFRSIKYLIKYYTLKSEIKKAFPKWIFNIMLLLQRESVEGAIEASILTSPPVLKRELRRITEMLSVKPHDPDAYMSFLKMFHDSNITEIMHKLYSLAIGVNRDSEVLDVVMEKNIKSLEKAERDSMMFKDSVKTFVWIPFFCVGFGCMGYLVIAIVTSINGIIQLI